VEYCDERACLSVCPRACLRNDASDLHRFSYLLPLVVARFSSSGVAIYCLLSVLWMTSYVHVMGHKETCRVDTVIVSDVVASSCGG